MLINTKWYYENSATIILTKKSEQRINEQIKEKNLKCSICGSNLLTITMMESSFITCINSILHLNYIDINYYQYKSAPDIIIINEN